METNFSHQRERSIARMSNSPRRSTQVVAGLTSPVMSVHPSTHAMDSIHLQPDFGLRTTDFFDDSSEEESLHEVSPGQAASDLDLFEKRASMGKRRPKSHPQQDQLVSRCEKRRSTALMDENGYQPLIPGRAEGQPDFVDTPSSSFNGSVDELLPGAVRSSPPREPQPVYMSSTRKKRNSNKIEQPTPMTSIKANQILGAHAIAHEITLQALMRDEEALDRSIQSFAPLSADLKRASIIPAALRVNDPRSPRGERAFSTPSSKKVQVMPPPIDTSTPHKSLPNNMIRTPYPFKPATDRDSEIIETTRDSRPTSTSTPHAPFESILTLSVRRYNTNSRSRITTLTIPASHDYSALRADSVGEKERHFKALDFDDEEFFRQLKACYTKMTGFPVRFSARSLTRIVVCGPASQAADASYGWLHSPRSPRMQMAPWKSLNNAFSEEKIMLHYKKPTLGTSRYAYVRWGHRLAGAQEDDDVQSPLALGRGERQPEGLEFVVGWSVSRILLGLALVIFLSVATTLPWTFLGRPSTSSPAGVTTGGFRDAGERVGTAVVMGICVLLVGLSGMAGWVGVSWVML